MSWWTKLHGPSAAGRAGELTWPVELEVVAGKLSARVYLHDIEFQGRPIACWSYVSHGLAALEQPEIVFTLRRDPDEPSDGFPQPKSGQDTGAGAKAAQTANRIWFAGSDYGTR
jgi:hypothetical protein